MKNLKLLLAIFVVAMSFAGCSVGSSIKPEQLTAIFAKKPAEVAEATIPTGISAKGALKIEVWPRNSFGRRGKPLAASIRRDA